MTNQLSTIIGFLIYLAFLFVIGFIFYGKSKNTSDYFLGGRKLGSFVTSMSAQASDMSGWILMGLPGAVYLTGLDGVWIAIGLIIGTYLNWKFIAKKLRTYTEVSGDSITIPSFLGNRFKDNSNILRLVSAIFIFIFFLIYTASAFVAGGKLFSSVFNISYTAALFIGAIAVVSYTFAGGFFAVCWTDFFQGILMFFAILLVPTIAVITLGGPTDVLDKINTLNPNMMNLFTTGAGATLPAISIISSLAWGLGYFGQPHILVRFMGIRSADDIKKSRKIAMVWVILSLFAAVAIGLVGRVYLGDLLCTPAGASETVYITMVGKLFPNLLGGILISAVLAAIMSTADSQLLVTASAITEDFYKIKVRPNASNKELLNVSRISVIIVSIIACLIALNPDSTVLGLVAYAWAGFGATFGPIILMSLFWKRTTKRGAVFGIILGGITTIIWRYLGLEFGGIFSLYEIVPGFLLSLITIIIVSLLDKEPTKDIIKEFEQVN